MEESVCEGCEPGFECEESGHDGGEGEDEGGTEVGVKACEEFSSEGEGGGFFDVEVETVKVVGGEESVEGAVVGLELNDPVRGL